MTRAQLEAPIVGQGAPSTEVPPAHVIRQWRAAFGGMHCAVLDGPPLGGYSTSVLGHDLPQLFWLLEAFVLAGVAHSRLDPPRAHPTMQVLLRPPAVFLCLAPKRRPEQGHSLQVCRPTSRQFACCRGNRPDRVCSPKPGAPEVQSHRLGYEEGRVPHISIGREGDRSGPRCAMR